MSDETRFDGLRVVVTGAASGMGEATARILGELGAEMHAIDIKGPTVDCAAFHETNLMDPDAIEATVAAVTAGGPVVADMGQDYMDRFPKPLVGRNATPTEQTWPLVLLNSDAMSIVNGTVLYTDQGFAGGLFTGQVDVSLLMPAEA